MSLVGRPCRCRRFLLKGGKCEFAAPARASRQRHESSHSRLRFNVSPCYTRHQGQQCADSAICKVANHERPISRDRPISDIQ